MRVLDAPHSGVRKIRVTKFAVLIHNQSIVRLALSVSAAHGLHGMVDDVYR